MIAGEEFDRWLEDPVTQWVMRGARAGAEANRQAWTDASWGQGQADPLMLAELRSRADAYMALAETGFEGWRSANGEDGDE